MLLHPGEQVAYNGSVSAAEGGRVAQIFLTNIRLVVELAGHGSLFGSHPAEIAVEASWADVRNASVISRPIGRPLLQIDTTHSRSSWKAVDAAEWVQRIAAMKSRFGYVAPPPSPAAPRPSVLSQTFERQVVKVRCRYCGTLGDEVVGKCAGCGAAL